MISTWRIGIGGLVVGGILMGLLALLDPAATASAQEAVERKNCPAGFKWVRMSGVGCVQEQLPP
ncbi:MAG: hypothetical protein ACYC1C_16490, partial [Chloroflexota bacterium]